MKPDTCGHCHMGVFWTGYSAGWKAISNLYSMLTLTYSGALPSSIALVFFLPRCLSLSATPAFRRQA